MNVAASKVGELVKHVPERMWAISMDRPRVVCFPIKQVLFQAFFPSLLPCQFSLLSEVRGVISPQDLDRFDNLVLKREIEFMKARQPSGTGTGTDSYSMMSYSDTVSSAGSHFTSTTVSSARVGMAAPSA